MLEGIFQVFQIEQRRRSEHTISMKTNLAAKHIQIRMSSEKSPNGCIATILPGRDMATSYGSVSWRNSSGFPHPQRWSSENQDGDRSEEEPEEHLVIGIRDSDVGQEKSH